MHPSLGLVPAIRACNTCMWNLGINFPLVKFYFHSSRVFTLRTECEGCRKKEGMWLQYLSWGRLILTPIFPSLLFLFFVLILPLSSIPPPPPHSRSKERADTSATARPPLSALFYFPWGRWSREQRHREEGRDAERPVSLLPSLCLLHPPLALSSHRIDLHSSPPFPL